MIKWLIYTKLWTNIDTTGTGKRLWTQPSLVLQGSQGSLTSLLLIFSLVLIVLLIPPPISDGDRCQCISPVLRNACFSDTGHPKIAEQALAGSAHWKQRVSSRNCFQQKYVFLWGECCWQAPELIEHMLPILSWNCHPLTIKVPKKVKGTCKGVGHPSY